MLKKSKGTFLPEKTYLYEGRQQTVREIAEANGIVPSTLHKRLARHNGDIEACVNGDFSHGKLIDLSDQKFGRLTVIERAGVNEYKQPMWKCICECGGEKTTLGMTLRKGDVQSCGCLHKEATSAASKTHGMSKTPIWSIHRSMIDRCHLPTSHAYNRYGGRGIYVCERWHSFENFFADMGNRPEGMSLDRVDNDGPYSPENVKWATYKEQANNRRSSVRYTYGDETLTVAQWAEKAEMPMRTLWKRINDCIPFPICLLNLDLRYAPC